MRERLGIEESGPAGMIGVGMADEYTLDQRQIANAMIRQHMDHVIVVDAITGVHEHDLFR